MITLYNEAEEGVFEGVALVGEMIETGLFQLRDFTLEIMAGAGLTDDVIEVIHRELGDTPLEGCTVVRGQTVCEGAESEDDATGVFEALNQMALGGDGGDGILALPIKIGLGIGDDECLCPQKQLWGELLILVKDACGETEIAQDAAMEKVTAG